MRAHLAFAFVVYRFLLFPVTVALVVISFFHPVQVAGHGVKRILLVLWVIAIIPPLGFLVRDGWRKWSAR